MTALGHADEAWILWTSAFEASIMQACDNVGSNIQCRGHGMIRTQLRLEAACAKIHTDGSFHRAEEKSFEANVRQQFNRLSKLKEYIGKIWQFTKPCQHV